LISKKRGQPSNRKTPDNVRSAVMAIVKKRYADFGPTLAAEKLREVHDLNVSRETLRAWMIADGLWQDRKKRRARVHQPRYRRDCVGELILTVYDRYYIDVRTHLSLEKDSPINRPSRRWASLARSRCWAGFTTNIAG